ncbi:MAG: type IV pilus assembly protein PilM [Planctomycetaceae bacterium]
MAAEAKSAWGIDIGHAGLKAIRLRTTDDGQSVRATAFDYIPHPKILSQPDAVPAELIEQSVAKFLERNNLGDDLIGISVPGHTSLAKFIKLPPVEPGKIAEIVQYEARQQIPFDLDEVVWDFQPIGGGAEESGFMLEAEVGLFAMKRELIFESMRPLMNKGEEVEVVQIAPLALYNYLSYDVLSFRKTAETPDPPDAEDYYIVLDMGADNTTLLVSNGRSIWIRNVPIGGNHFTRALTREMKLTFAKAEHLKCNATKSPDPKAVFQAMRPVFNDYVTEIQRSIGYFGSVNRTAKIKKVIGVGNGFRLAGLQKFLQQNLQYEVERLEHLDGVTGDSVLSDPLFMDNVMTFAVPYGLALQTLKQTRIQTTLLPPEIVTQRKIRSKKPWVVAAVAVLLLGLGISTGMTASVARSVGTDRFKEAYAEVDSLKKFVGDNTAAYAAQQTAHTTMLKEIDNISAPLKRRSLWLELYKAVNECLPQDEGNDLDEVEVAKQKKIRIESMVTKRVASVADWHAQIVADENLKEKFLGEDAAKPPVGEGYIVTLTGHHYHNHKDLDFRNTEEAFIKDTLVTQLRSWAIDHGGHEVPVGQLGISHPIVLWSEPVEEFYDPNNRETGIGPGLSGAGRGGGGMRMGGRGMFSGEGGDEDVGGSGGGRGGRGRRGISRRLGRGGVLDGEGGDEDLGSGGGRGRLGRVPERRILTPVDELENEDDSYEWLVRTDFQLQFSWVPMPEAKRLPEPPGAAGTPTQPAP